MKQLTIVGAGWAGLAAAVAATQAGWHVKLFEASNIAGGRARSLQQSFAGKPLDNGQHVLIGAYSQTLALMRTVGLNPHKLLKRIPLDLRFADGQGLSLPNCPLPLNMISGLSRAQGWTLKDKASLMQAAWGWHRARFECELMWTVAQLCNASPRCKDPWYGWQPACVDHRCPCNWAKFAKAPIKLHLVRLPLGIIIKNNLQYHEVPENNILGNLAPRLLEKQVTMNEAMIGCT
jgi:hypothetical protein